MGVILAGREGIGSPCTSSIEVGASGWMEKMRYICYEFTQASPL